MELLLRERVAVGKRIGGNQVFYRPNKSNLFQSGTEQREGLLSLVNSCHSFFHKARSLAPTHLLPCTSCSCMSWLQMLCIGVTPTPPEMSRTF